MPRIVVSEFLTLDGVIDSNVSGNGVLLLTYVPTDEQASDKEEP